MLQTPFMDGESPIAWAILNIPDSHLNVDDPEELPPILTRLLRCYGSPNDQLMQSIRSACCTRDSNQLLQLLETRVAQTDAFSANVVTLNRCAPGSLNWSSHYDFTIANFRERMLLEGRIDMVFVHSGERAPKRCTVIADSFSRNSSSPVQRGICYSKLRKMGLLLSDGPESQHDGDEIPQSNTRRAVWQWRGYKRLGAIRKPQWQSA